MCRPPPTSQLCVIVTLHNIGINGGVTRHVCALPAVYARSCCIMHAPGRLVLYSFFTYAQTLRCSLMVSCVHWILRAIQERVCISAFYV